MWRLDISAGYAGAAYLRALIGWKDSECRQERSECRAEVLLLWRGDERWSSCLDLGALILSCHIARAGIEVLAYLDGVVQGNCLCCCQWHHVTRCGDQVFETHVSLGGNVVLLQGRGDNSWSSSDDIKWLLAQTSFRAHAEQV